MDWDDDLRLTIDAWLLFCVLITVSVSTFGGQGRHCVLQPGVSAAADQSRRAEREVLSDLHEGGPAVDQRLRAIQQRRDRRGRLAS